MVGNLYSISSFACIIILPRVGEFSSLSVDLYSVLRCASIPTRSTGEGASCIAKIWQSSFETRSGLYPGRHCKGLSVCLAVGGAIWFNRFNRCAICREDEEESCCMCLQSWMSYAPQSDCPRRGTSNALTIFHHFPEDKCDLQQFRAGGRGLQLRVELVLRLSTESVPLPTRPASVSLLALAPSCFQFSKCPSFPNSCPRPLSTRRAPPPRS